MFRIHLMIVSLWRDSYCHMGHFIVLRFNGIFHCGGSFLQSSASLSNRLYLDLCLTALVKGLSKFPMSMIKIE